MLLAAVRRVRQPGCKFDFILVLEGPQGVGKSTLLRILAGDENFSDNEILGYQKREQQEAVQGIWIYELAELDGMSKSEVTRVKLFASKQCDMARPAYHHGRVDRPRRCVFVATTNEDTYLRDATGNRRFWPVKVGKIDLAGVARDRDQLWAEAAAMEATGEGLVIAEGLWTQAAIEQKARREPDAWEDPISNRLAGFERKGIGAGQPGQWAIAVNSGGHRELRVSTPYILEHILGFPKDRQSDAVSKRLANVMRDMGWTRPDTMMRIGGAGCRGFTKALEEKAKALEPPVVEAVVEKPVSRVMPMCSVLRVRRLFD
jgi:predicted P-loop ATPase